MSGRSSIRVGIYVDASNLATAGGYGMRYDVLRQFATRGGAEALRLNVYVPFDWDRSERDADYRSGQLRFHAALRDLGYKVIQKRIRRVHAEEGQVQTISSVESEISIDALMQSDRLDRIVIVTGEGDFVSLTRTLQAKGCRVEVIGFDNVSAELRREADLFLSGYLIPNLIPPSRNNGTFTWGELGSVVRGVCYHHDSGKGFGFIRYLKRLNGDPERVDTRDPNSDYGTVFFHDSELPKDIEVTTLPSRNTIFEFQLAEGAQPGQIKAVNVESVRTRY